MSTLAAPLQNVKTREDNYFSSCGWPTDSACLTLGHGQNTKILRGKACTSTLTSNSGLQPERKP